MKHSVLCDITDQALNAFWQVIVDRFPEATTGDLSPLTTLQLGLAAETAIAEWLRLNISTQGGRHAN
jgi:hypothetical protein